MKHPAEISCSPANNTGITHYQSPIVDCAHQLVFPIPGPEQAKFDCTRCIPHSFASAWDLDALGSRQGHQISRPQWFMLERASPSAVDPSTRRSNNSEQPLSESDFIGRSVAEGLVDEGRPGLRVSGWIKDRGSREFAGAGEGAISGRGLYSYSTGSGSGQWRQRLGEEKEEKKREMGGGQGFAEDVRGAGLFGEAEQNVGVALLGYPVDNAWSILLILSACLQEAIQTR